MSTHPWPSEWILGEPVSPPGTWGMPGLVVTFNLECAGCVGRAIPWLKRVAPRATPHARVLAVHSAYGHKHHPRENVIPRLTEYARDFAQLPFPVAVDMDGSWAEAMGAEGTPHWFIWNAGGALERSIYGSQENALTRLSYLLEGWGVAQE